MDIGCGAGILLCYLHLQGFNYLSGIEIDEDLYNKCIMNLNSVKCGTNRIHKADALHFDDIDDINVFYLFNPFYYPETYKEWVGRVKDSWSRNNRHIKIILLFPTISSIIAFKESGWLKKKCRIIDEAQVCSRCVNYMIFENEES